MPAATHDRATASRCQIRPATVRRRTDGCPIGAHASARALSLATVATRKQNLAFAFVYNALGVPIAAGVLYPFTGWLLSPVFAALAMSLGSVSVISNALRLRGAVIRKG